MFTFQRWFRHIKKDIGKNYRFPTENLAFLYEDFIEVDHLEKPVIEIKTEYYKLNPKGEITYDHEIG